MSRYSEKDNRYIFLQIVSMSAVVSSVLRLSTTVHGSNKRTDSPLPIPTRTINPLDIEDTIAPSTATEREFQCTYIYCSSHCHLAA